MIAIGRYFVFMISVTATMSSPPRTENVVNMDNEKFKPFLCHIFHLHNEFRRIHGVPKLELDDNLSKDARDILDKIYTDQKKLIPTNIGSNIGDGKFKEISDLNAVEARRLFLNWYNTGEGYDYENEPSKKTAEKAAPFTQILWKNTKKMGVTMSVKDDGTYDIVVTYSPLGNKKKHYKNNVRRINQT